MEVFLGTEAMRLATGKNEAVLEGAHAVQRPGAALEMRVWRLVLWKRVQLWQMDLLKLDQTLAVGMAMVLRELQRLQRPGLEQVAVELVGGHGLPRWKVQVPFGVL